MDSFCPRCETLLGEALLGSCVVRHCNQCGGHFLDFFQMKQLFPPLDKEPPEADIEAIRMRVKRFSAPEEVEYLRCPVCRVRMQRSNFGPGSGVIVNECWEHGAWFDEHGIEHIQEYIASGGLVLSWLEAKQREHDTKKAKENKAFYDTVMDMGSPAGHDMF